MFNFVLPLLILVGLVIGFYFFGKDMMKEFEDR
jgi:uncharacterized protein YneF (UPF0154 family)